MIESFRHGWLEDFFVEDKAGKRVPANIRSALFRRLQMIDDATDDRDLRPPPSNHFEKLAGQLKDYHSIRVSAKWRLIFKWDGGGKASDLYLDPHDYK